MNILMIEDDIVFSEFIKQALKKFDDIYIVTKESLREGLGILTSFSFDCILLDLTLPDSNGINTFLSLYNNCNHIPIIILSGLQDEILAQESVKLGAQTFIFKDEIKLDTISVLYRHFIYACERNKILNSLDDIIQQKIHDQKIAYDHLFEIIKVQNYILCNNVSEDELNYLLRKFSIVLQSKSMYIIECEANNNFSILLNNGLKPNLDFSLINTPWAECVTKKMQLSYESSNSTFFSNGKFILLTPLYSVKKVWGILSVESDIPFSELFCISIELIGNLISFIKIRLDEYKKMETLKIEVEDTITDLHKTFKILQNKLGET